MRLPLRPVAFLTATLLLLATPSAEAQRRPAGAAVTACTDFFAHTNRDWLRAHPASAAEPQRSRLAQLTAESAMRQNALLTAAIAHPQNANERLLGAFWAAGTDEAGLGTNSGPALRAALAPLDGLRRPRDLAKTGAALHMLGLAPMVEFLRLESEDGSERTLAAVPAPLGLVDPAFYTSTETEARVLLGHYRRYIETVLRASGLPEVELGPASEAVLQIETQLAQALAGEAAGTQSRDTLRAQNRRFGALGLTDLLKRLDAPATELVIVNPAYFGTLTRIANEGGVQGMKWFLRFRVVHRLAPDLDRPFRAAHEQFFAQTLRGLPAGPSRTEHLQNLLRQQLPGLVDSSYNARYAPEHRRQRASVVIDAVRNAAVELIGKSDARAAERLAKARIDVAGSTTPAFDGSGLEFRTNDHVGNLQRLWRWREAAVLANRHVTVDPVPAHLPTVLWIADTATLTVSAAALASPLLFEGGSAPPASDFGALGALVGHEFSKAIDAGSRGANLGSLFNGLQVAPNLRVDGARTLAMNRADLSGLEFAWTAFTTTQPQADTKAKQAFFTAWAGLWATTQTTDALRAELQSSVYAPAVLRVNTNLAQLPAFAETFGCRVGQPMRAANPIAVWR